MSPAGHAGSVQDAPDVARTSLPSVTTGAKRPKWRLCFRLDRRSPTAKESAEDTQMKHQRDFFVTVVDPPSQGTFKDNPPAPFFASRAACHVADLIASRPMLTQLPGHCFKGRTLAAVGQECMTAGLVAAMLGAKVVLVSERELLHYVQQNVRLFRKDTLDYTKTKNTTLVAVPCSESRPRNIQAELLCEQLQAPVLDLVVLTELSLARVVGDFGGIVGSQRASTLGKSFFDWLGDIVPPRASTKVLVICDQSYAELTDPLQQAFGGELSDSMTSGSMPSWLQGEGLPPGLDGVLPSEWHARPFCQLPQNIPVLWLERQDAEFQRTHRKPQATNRAPLPPMGASSSRCGLGGNLQSSVAHARTQNEEWFANNARLKEALSLHNQSKHTEAVNVLEQARAFAFGAGMPPPTAPQLDNLVEATSHDEAMQVSHSSGFSQGGYGVSRRPLPPPNSARSSRSAARDRSKRNQGSKTARSATIAERHASPPYWYNCNRPVYG
eukprot:TRINITY_DN42245_c0_g1_i1.p1 TRINITY_DN42245_c0_g1~~TRINITY_DN42245_c0_g1_i1.p1  ORF type:complete len:497 (-),score=88.34 TRINITY_DN42245_c0_g1_i1:13-1503(-)